MTGLETNSAGVKLPSSPSGLPYYHSPAEQLVSPLEQLAATSNYLLSKPGGHFQDKGITYALPRYVLLGPRGGGEVFRLGLFATLHGNEPEGALALTRFLTDLVRQPALATNFCLFIYPVCNPTGLEDNTLHSRAGKDLSQEFWTESTAPEVKFLESEIWMHAFHGVITINSDRETEGIYGQVNGAVLSEYLLKPALAAADTYLPRSRQRVIEGAPARRGIVHQIKDGRLRPPPRLQPSPFEIVLASPAKMPLQLQVEGINAALHSILHEYRTLMSTAQDI
jgi:protein MpaA